MDYKRKFSASYIAKSYKNAPSNLARTAKQGGTMARNVVGRVRAKAKDHFITQPNAWHKKRIEDSIGATNNPDHIYWKQ